MLERTPMSDDVACLGRKGCSHHKNFFRIHQNLYSKSLDWTEPKEEQENDGMTMQWRQLMGLPLP